MEGIRDGSPEDAEGLTVQGVQGTCGHVYRNLTRHKQILVEDELQLLIGLIATLDQTGTCMELQTAAGLQSQLCFYSAATALCLGNIGIRQGP